MAKIDNATIVNAKIAPNAVQATVSDGTGPTYQVTAPNQAVLPVLLGFEGRFNYNTHATCTWSFRITRTRGSVVFVMPPIVLATTGGSGSQYDFDLFSFDSTAAANDVYTASVVFSGAGFPAPTWSYVFATLRAVYQKR